MKLSEVNMADECSLESDKDVAADADNNEKGIRGL